MRLSCFLPQKPAKNIHPGIRIRYSPLPKENGRELRPGRFDLSLPGD